MRKVVTILLLFCVGLLIPTAAGPLRVCILDCELSAVPQDSTCCENCERETAPAAPCCYDLEKLPDSPAPDFPVELPAAVITDLQVAWLPKPVVKSGENNGFRVLPAIRGPTSPAAQRAVLGVWRL